MRIGCSYCIHYRTKNTVQSLHLIPSQSSAPPTHSTSSPASPLPHQPTPPHPQPVLCPTNPLHLIPSQSPAPPTPTHLPLSVEDRFTNMDPDSQASTNNTICLNFFWECIFLMTSFNSFAVSCKRLYCSYYCSEWKEQALLTLLPDHQGRLQFLELHDPQSSQKHNHLGHCNMEMT